MEEKLEVIHDQLRSLTTKVDDYTEKLERLELQKEIKTIGSVDSGSPGNMAETEVSNLLLMLHFISGTFQTHYDI